MIVESRDDSPLSEHLPPIGQDFLIDSPLATPPASDWPADDDWQPTGHAQPRAPARAYCGAPDPSSHSSASLARPISTRALRSVVLRAPGPTEA